MRRERHRAGVLLAHHQEIVRPLEADEVALGVEVRVGRAVPLEVIGRNERHHRDVRRPAHRAQVLQHKAGQLQHHQVGLVDSPKVRKQRAADVSADPGGELTLQDVAEHRGCGGLSLGPGDADDRGGAALDEELDLGRNGDARCAGRAEIGTGGGDGGGGDDELGGGEVFLALLAEAELDRQPVELRDRFGQLLGRRLVGHEHSSSLLDQPPRHRDAPAEAAEPRDRHPLVPDFLHAHVDHIGIASAEHGRA